MILADTAKAINKELLRLQVDYDPMSNRDGLVCRTEPSRKPPAVRMGSDWFSAPYEAESLLYYLQCLRLEPRDRERFWQSGQIWRDLRERNIEMLEVKV